MVDKVDAATVPGRTHRVVTPNTVATNVGDWGSISVPGPPASWLLECLEANGWTILWPPVPTVLGGQPALMLYVKCERVVIPAKRLPPVGMAS